MSELALNEHQAGAHSGDDQLVTMKVGAQLFGVPILKVQDIVETHTITQVPMAPSAVAGVMNLRGRVVTVVNLRRILGQTEDTVSRMGVTVEHDGDLYTILVDEIGEVMSMESTDIQPTPTTLEDGLKLLCSGIYRLETGLLAVLDIDRILDAETILRTPQIDFVARKRLLKRLEEEAANKRMKRIEKTKDEKDERKGAKKGTPEEETKADADAETKSGSAEEQDAPQQEALYQRIGGSVAVEAAVELFYEKVMADESLVPFFEGIDMRRQHKMLNDFMSMALGGPNSYSGRTLRAAHKRLVNEKGLGNEHFDAVAGHLVATLKQLKVPADIIDEAVSIVGGTRDDVLGG